MPRRTTILIVDDEQVFLESVRRGLRVAGYRDILLEHVSGRVADLFDDPETHIDLVLLDVNMPDMNGIQLLGLIREKSPRTQCIMVTARNDAQMAVQCLKKGAYDYLVKPVSRDDLLYALERALERKKLQDLLDIHKGTANLGLQQEGAFAALITRSENVRRVLKEAELHADSDVPVLITGESGTGKELLARAIHDASPRSRFPYTPINMAALSGTLFEGEFFGHRKGAFTGAEVERKGYLESTDKGTIFLDEIGTMPLEFQGKLLRVLQEGEYFKLGTSQPSRADVRFVAATNEDVEQLLRRKLFREDFYYRLKGAWLHLPPLRERPADIPLLIDYFLDEYGHSRGRTTVLDDRALDVLMAYPYPGNVRELKSIIMSALNLATGGVLTVKCLPCSLAEQVRGTGQAACGPGTKAILPLAAVERCHILASYKKTGQNKAMTANLLGIGLNTLRRKLKGYDVA